MLELSIALFPETENMKNIYLKRERLRAVSSFFA
jgi:hypothetical protein